MNLEKIQTRIKSLIKHKPLDAAGLNQWENEMGLLVDMEMSLLESGLTPQSDPIPTTPESALTESIRETLGNIQSRLERIESRLERIESQFQPTIMTTEEVERHD